MHFYATFCHPQCLLWMWCVCMAMPVLTLVSAMVRQQTRTIVYLITAAWHVVIKVWVLYWWSDFSFLYLIKSYFSLYCKILRCCKTCRRMLFIYLFISMWGINGFIDSGMVVVIYMAETVQLTSRPHNSESFHYIY